MAIQSNKFVEYQYTGRAVITFDDHHPELEVDFEKGDKFKLKIVKNEAHIIHEAAPKEVFKMRFNDKKYLRLFKSAELTEFIFTPSPLNPTYPHLDKLDVKTMEMLYVYYNERYFNNVLPKPVHVLFSTKIPAHYKNPAVGLAESFSAHNKGKFRISVEDKGDPYLFVDIILHEMIHIYQYVMLSKGDTTVHDNGDYHGAWFQKEMNRINKDGYNIDLVLNWEKRAKSAPVSDFYIMRCSFLDVKSLKPVSILKGAKSNNWHSSIGVLHERKPTQSQMERYLAAVQALDSTCAYQVEVFKVNDSEWRKLLPEAPARITRNKLGGVHAKLDGLTYRDGKIMETPIAESVLQSGGDINPHVNDIPYMIGTLQEYKAHIRQRHLFDYEGHYERAWAGVPIREVNKELAIRLKKLSIAIAFGENEKQIDKSIADIVGMYTNRFTTAQYQKAARDAIKKNKLTSLDPLKLRLKL